MGGRAVNLVDEVVNSKTLPQNCRNEFCGD
jgi:hypothetical protein